MRFKLSSDTDETLNVVLDNAHVEYSYKHTCLVTLTVDGNGNPPSQDAQEWRIPTYDPRNEKKYLYRLHALDIYFWAKEDALLFLSATRRILPQRQLTILDEPMVPPTHSDDMSPVVQNLENVAISDPSYQNGRTRDSRPTASRQDPPTSEAIKSEEKLADFAPLAYNPAAPAAPEAIRHREKTPPPPEDDNTNPLAAAAVSDKGQPFSPGYQPIFSGPPTATFGPNLGTYFPGPPQAAAPVLPYIPPPPTYSQNPYTQQAGVSSPHLLQTQFANQPGTPGFQSSIQSPGFSGPPKAEATPPPSGFSNYQYSQAQSAPLMTDYNIHHQIYRPTEGEAAIKYKPAKEPRGKLEDNAMKAEKGVTSFLKKLEKKYG
jgi:hypothetical protein